MNIFYEKNTSSVTLPSGILKLSKNIFKYLLILLIILSNLLDCLGVLANDIDEIAPFKGVRNDFLPGESFLKRDQYWSSSVVQIDNEPFFNLSTRATSLATSIHYDLLMYLFGKSCNKVNIMIFTDKYSEIDNVTNQFGQILFDGEKEYNFRFFVKTFSGSNAIGFHPGDVDALMRMMQKSNYMTVNLPSIGKRIHYDLRGFSASLQRTSKMCMSGHPR